MARIARRCLRVKDLPLFSLQHSFRELAEYSGERPKNASHEIWAVEGWPRIQAFRIALGHVFQEVGFKASCSRFVYGAGRPCHQQIVFGRFASGESGKSERSVWQDFLES